MSMKAVAAKSRTITQKKSTSTTQDDALQPRVSRVENALTLEVGLYLLALLVGAVLRLLLVDARPLSVEEGSLASESYRMWQGQPPDSLHQGPFTAFGTALTLALFAGGDGAARLLSALFGSVLVGTPYLLRNSLGRSTALIAAWGLAISPLVVFASRDVGSGIVPLCLSVLLWWLVEGGTKNLTAPRGYVLAVVLASLIACGAEGFSVLVTLGLAGVLSHPRPRLLLSDLRAFLATPLCRRVGLAFVAALLTIGTGFGTNLRGIQWMLVDSWAGWLSAFSLTSPRSALIWMLVAYELPVVLMALVQLLRTLPRRERVDLFLSLWAMLLLLACMLQTGSLAARVVLPIVPIYLLAARLLGSTISATARAATGWRWNSAVVAVVVPIAVGTVLTNRGTTQGLEVPPMFLYGEALLVVASVAALVVLLNGDARRALGWYAAITLSIGLMVHNSVTTNFITASADMEPVVGAEPSAPLRNAARDASYFSRFYGTPVTVDAQLKGPLEWYLRDARNVQYGTEQSEGVSIILFRSQGQDPKPDTERRPGILTPSVDLANVTWQGLWRWVVFRDGLVRPDSRDIIVRAPAGNW
jgi:predicted membrane-bound mannosyltransferase